MKLLKFCIYILISLCVIIAQEKPQLALTFDDGNSKNRLSYDYNKINNMILDHLGKHKVKALLYVCGRNMDNKNGDEVLTSWNNAEHILANHTYSHWHYHNEKVSVSDFTNDISKCDSLLKKYPNYIKYFRAPYLKRGNTVEKRDGLTEYLKQNNYKNGYVTIDTQEWFYNHLLSNSIKENDEQDIKKIKKSFIEHMIDIAKFYDDLATKMQNRKIKHSILLHHNLINALYLDDLIVALKNNGWDIINADDALKDEIYNREMSTLPAGESIIWSLAKESGKYEKELKYLVERRKYEENQLHKSKAAN